jgi:two-component system sensor histidine kinase TctE
MAADEPSTSLRQRLLLRLLAPLLLLWLLSGALCYLLALHYANSVYDDWLYDSASSLATGVRRTPAGVTLDLSDSARRLFEWDVLDTTYFKISDGSGQAIGRPELPPVPPDARRLRQASMFDAQVEGRPVRVAVIRLAGELGPPVQVEVAETTAKRHALAREILLGILVPQGVLIGVAALAVWFGVRRGLAPVSSIARRIEAQTHRKLTPIADADVPAELRPLTRALNELLQRLDQALVAQRRFIADAAHQLRTPLTALKLDLELVRRCASPQEAEAGLLQLDSSVRRTIRLAQQLLALARAEPEARSAVEFRSLDLRELAQQVGAEWVPSALVRHIELSFHSEAAPIPVYGDAQQLREALNNLLDNAIKYHPGGGSVTLEVQAVPTPRVIVEDDGPGIPESERERMFERFRRGATNGAEGSGLGLAIVREIALAHGGAVTLSAACNKGLRVCLELPPPALVNCAAA